MNIASFPLTSATPLDKAALPTETHTTATALQAFAKYFDLMTGCWNSERTFHYVAEGRRKDFQTTFDVRPLEEKDIFKVLSSNSTATSELSNIQRRSTQGFNVSFLSKMANSEELLRSATNVALVPTSITDMGVIRGDYYRDLAYKETGPKKAKFAFDASKMELVMTTFYTKEVSVDTISLVEDGCRLRKIVNYRRVGDGVGEVLLAGFGIEKKKTD